jgi:anti-anti-sigma factor
MRAHQQAAPLVVVRSEAESGRVGLRLIGELDLHTVELLEAELAGSRDQSPPAVIDLSELRFLDLVGLRALLRAGTVEGAPVTRLVGATGIVRRLIELTRALDDTMRRSVAGGLSARVVVETIPADALEAEELSANGNGNGASKTNGNGRRAPTRNGGAR